MTPRKHSELIKAWADGAEIQVRIGNNPLSEWLDAPDPTWQKCYEYRIKPEKKVIRYRRYFYECVDNLVVSTICDIPGFHIPASELERYDYFKGWIDTEWQEVEV